MITVLNYGNWFHIFNGVLSLFSCGVHCNEYEKKYTVLTKRVGNKYKCLYFFIGETYFSKQKKTSGLMGLRILSMRGTYTIGCGFNIIHVQNSWHFYHVPVMTSQ